MNILTFSDIIELNKVIQESGMAYKIHMSDACGGQSFRIEVLEGEGIDEKLYGILDEFFSGKRMTVKYNQKRTEFCLV